MNEPILGARLVADFIVAGIEGKQQVVGVGLRGVGAVVFFLGVEHGRHVAVEEGVAHVGVGDAFGFGAHRVGGDVVPVAVCGGHGVGFEGAVVGGEDLEGGGAGCAVLDGGVVSRVFVLCFIL